jgi:tetratricopeptide (TPR) repeat protein
MLRPIRHLLTVLLCLMAANTAVLAGPWEEANAAFAAGEYSNARNLYEQVIAQEGPSAARLFNLGNTHAKLDQPGPAVLCYERAALLAPRDADIQANLKLTRPATASSLTAPPPWWKSPLYWLSLHEWSWIAAAGLTLAAIPLLARTLPRFRPRWLQASAAPLLGGGVALGLLGGLALQQRGSETKLAILTAREPVLRLSPFPGANPVDAAPPHPGQRILPDQRHGSWLHLTIPGSTTAGWVPDKDVTLIIPSSP